MPLTSLGSSYEVERKYRIATATANNADTIVDDRVVRALESRCESNGICAAAANRGIERGRRVRNGQKAPCANYLHACEFRSTLQLPPSSSLSQTMAIRQEVTPCTLYDNYRIIYTAIMTNLVSASYIIDMIVSPSGHMLQCRRQGGKKS